MTTNAHDIGHDRQLPVLRVGDLPLEASPRRWLIEGLWGAAAVGILGGSPKSGKTFLGLDMALSVATGTPCLGRFRVAEPGPSLVYLAEDSLHAVRQRAAALARHRRLALERIDLHVITAPALRLDHAEDRGRLFAAVERLRPRLLLLDPLVRLHRCDENDSGAVSALLAHLRTLQRHYDVAVVLVHHARKGGASQGGEGLRGSIDLWAWCDSNLYLRRAEGKLLLSMEHRAAPAPEPVSLTLLNTDEEAIHLEVVAGYKEKHDPETRLCATLLAALAAAPSGLTRTELRDKLRVKNTRLGQALRRLEADGRVARLANGWRATDPAP
jgi:hypothetical protein